MRRHETLMGRTTTTSAPLVQTTSQSQSSVTLSAPISIPERESEIPMEITTEPESKVSEPAPTTASNTFIGFKVYSDSEIYSFRKILSGRPVRIKTKDGSYEYVYYQKGNTHYQIVQE